MPTQKIVAIVEDDSSALAALTSLVNALGYGARGFSHPSSFLAPGAAREISCLIADVRLPGISGVTLYQRLRMKGISMPTILITAYPDEATRMSALKAGVHAYLTKPVEPEKLLLCLKTVAL